MQKFDLIKKVLHTLNLVDSNSVVDALVSYLVTTPDVNSRAHIVFIALDNLEFIVLLQF